MIGFGRGLAVCGALCLAGGAFAQEEPPIDDFNDPGWKAPLKQLNIKLDRITVEVQEIDCDDVLVTSVDGLVEGVVTASSRANIGVLGVQGDVDIAYAGLTTTVRPRMVSIGHTIEARIVECVVADFTCTNGILSGEVNGKEFTQSCGEYACYDENVCNAGCGLDSDCADGFFCADTGSCEALRGPICSGAFQVGPTTYHTSSIDTHGFEDDCSPYTCEGGTCRTRCGTSSDCAPGTVCDTLNSVCVVVGGGQ